MTHEENFQRIENALRHSTEIQAQHAEQIARSESKTEKNAAAIERSNAAIERSNAAIERSNAAIEKNAAAIKDLIVVSRTLIDSQQRVVDLQQRAHETLDQKMAELEESRKRGQEEFNANLNALIQAQMETEQKLQRWIDRHSN